jgi:ABC-2 type transport system ATP-binding protein
MMRDLMVEITGLQKIIDQRTVVDIEALSVAGGEIVAVVGPAGCGKETLFELLIGRLRPSVGTLRLAGAISAEKENFSRMVGVVFAEDALYKNRSLIGNLVFHAQMYGLPRQAALEALARVGLSEQAETRLDRLPSGLQRRVAFARAILHRPQVYLLFTPFARCDESTIGLLAGLIRELAAEGAAVLILAEDASHLESAGAAIYLMNQGRVSLQPSAGTNRDEPLPLKIPVRLEDKVILVNPAEILFAVAEGGRTFLQLAGQRLPVQFTLNELEGRLIRCGFFRAHRSYLVNLQQVKEVISFTRDSFNLRLADAGGTQIPLSKSAAAELRELLGY